MRLQDIVLGEFYRLKWHPTYGYAKAVEILKPKQGINPHSYLIVKCEYILNKKETFGLIKYFRLSDLIREK